MEEIIRRLLKEELDPIKEQLQTISDAVEEIRSNLGLDESEIKSETESETESLESSPSICQSSDSATDETDQQTALNDGQAAVRNKPTDHESQALDGNKKNEPAQVHAQIKEEDDASKALKSEREEEFCAKLQAAARPTTSPQPQPTGELPAAETSSSSTLQSNTTAQSPDPRADEADQQTALNKERPAVKTKPSHHESQAFAGSEKKEPTQAHPPIKPQQRHPNLHHQNGAAGNQNVMRPPAPQPTAPMQVPMAVNYGYGDYPPVPGYQVYQPAMAMQYQNNQMPQFWPPNTQMGTSPAVAQTNMASMHIQPQIHHAAPQPPAPAITDTSNPYATQYNSSVPKMVSQPQTYAAPNVDPSKQTAKSRPAITDTSNPNATQYNSSVPKMVSQPQTYAAPNVDPSKQTTKSRPASAGPPIPFSYQQPQSVQPVPKEVVKEREPHTLQINNPDTNERISDKVSRPPPAIPRLMDLNIKPQPLHKSVSMSADSAELTGPVKGKDPMKKYDREFLLSLQFQGLSMKKPDDLMASVDFSSIALKEPITYRREMKTNRKGIPDFTPAYFNRNTSNNGKPRRSGLIRGSLEFKREPLETVKRPDSVRISPAAVPSEGELIADREYVRAQLTADEWKIKMKGTIDEYVHSNDLREAVECVKEILPQNNLDLLTESAIYYVLQKSETARKHAGHLMSELVHQKLLPLEKHLKGMAGILEIAVHLADTIPIWIYLAQIFAPPFTESRIPLSQLKAFCKPLEASQTSHLLVAGILNEAACDLGHIELSRKWSESGLDWKKDFLPEDLDVSTFLQEQKLEWISKTHSDTQELGTEQLWESLAELLSHNKPNEYIIDLIDSQLDSEQQSTPEFTRHLSKAVLTHCLKKDKQEFNEKCFKYRVSLLRRSIDTDTQKQMSALIAAEDLVTQLGHPNALLKDIFFGLTDKDIVADEVFWQWEASCKNRVAVQSSKEFFEWLREDLEEDE